MASASAPLPVPVSPSTSTVDSLWAMRSASAKRRRMATLRPSTRPKAASALTASVTCSSSRSKRTSVVPTENTEPGAR